MAKIGKLGKRGKQGTWPYHERSTRNCVNAKVIMVEGEPKIKCSKGRHLSKVRHNGLYVVALKTTIRQAIFVSPVCKNCTLFEHDEERR